MTNPSIIPTRALRVFAATATWLLLGTSGAVSADVYKWVDERGVVNYSDEVPQGRSAQKMDRTMNRLIVVPRSPDSTEGARRLADDLMRARLEREHRDQINRYMDQTARMEPREEGLLTSWRQRCLAEQWADCDHAPTLYNRYAEFPYHVPLVQSRVPLAPTVFARPFPPRIEAPRLEAPRAAPSVERPATPTAPVRPGARRTDR